MKKRRFGQLSLTAKILKTVLIVGTIYIAASSPYFILSVLRNFRQRKYWKVEGQMEGEEEDEGEKFKNTFYYLKRRSYLNIRVVNNQIYISLTKEGKKRAGKYQIDDLEIKTPKKWDRKWRLIIFDIPNKQKVKREAFRGKLKELGLCPLQKSVWIYPYVCQKEIKLLREFFGLNARQLRIIATSKLEEDDFLRRKFKLINLA